MQGSSANVFHDECRLPIEFLKRKDRSDVWMSHAGQSFRFDVDALGAALTWKGGDLNGDLAIQ